MGAEGAAAVVLRDAKGSVMHVTMSPWLTDAGPRTNVLEQTVETAWIADYVTAHGREPQARELAGAFLVGLRKDRSTLEKLGLKGFESDSGGNVHFLPFDKIEANLTRRVAAQANIDSRSQP
jgi:hypothetical protein